MKIKEIQMEHALYKDEMRLFLRFPFDRELIGIVKNHLPEAKWSYSQKAWHILYQKDVPMQVINLFALKGIKLNYLNENAEIPAPQLIAAKKPINEIRELSADVVTKIKSFKQWMRSKRYSESTISTYVDALHTFLRFYHDKEVSALTNDDVVFFNNDYILKNKLSASFQNQVVNAIKLFFRTIESKAIDIEQLHRPKRSFSLPNVLSKEEIKQLLSAHVNIKHRAMLSLIYSCGLRRSELLNLKLTDIDTKRGLVIIRQAKGRKDRIAPLSNKMFSLLEEYFTAAKPKEWLFEGQGASGKYDESSLAAVLKQALEKSKINKPVTLHWLRHSYATHLLEGGTDLRYIQEILGHSRSTTTEIYTHVSNKNIQRVISPFDTL